MRVTGLTRNSFRFRRIFHLLLFDSVCSQNIFAFTLRIFATAFHNPFTHNRPIGMKWSASNSKHSTGICLLTQITAKKKRSAKWLMASNRIHAPNTWTRRIQMNYSSCRDAMYASARAHTCLSACFKLASAQHRIKIIWTVCRLITRQVSNDETK